MIIKMKSLICNILLTLLSCLPFWVIVKSAYHLLTSDFEHFSSWWAWIASFLFISAGIGVALKSSKRVESMMAEGNIEAVEKYSKKLRRAYAIIAVVIWGAGLYCGIALPGFFSYMKRGHDSGAKVALNKLIETQTSYHQSSGIYAPDTLTLERFGLKIEPDVTLNINSADKNCWKGAAKHKKSTSVFEADCSGNITQIKN